MAPKQGRRSPTMHDVATLAGVSQTTVSLVLNGASRGNIPEVTRKRVRAAARELGYRPNAAAKLLATSKSNLIGLITDEVATTPFAGGIIKAAQEAAWRHNKLLIAFNTGGQEDIEEAAVDVLLQHQVEGIIYASMYHRPVELPANIREIPAVLVNCYAVDRSLPSVVPDELGGGRAAGEFLIARGHRRIGFININTLESGLPAAVGRFEGYKQALAAHNLPFDEALVGYGWGSAEDGYHCTLELMKQASAPTAIFCGNDRTAMGAYDALKELGLRIPGDVAIVGFDNLEMIATQLHPSLSTMELPHHEMGRWGVEYLLSHAGITQDDAPVQHTSECAFIPRSSV